MQNKFAISILALSFAVATAAGCTSDSNNNSGGTGGTVAGTGGNRGTGGSGAGTGGAGTGGTSGGTGGAGTGGTSGGTGGAGTGGSTGTGGASTDAGTGGATGDAKADVVAETGGGDTAAAVKYADVKPIFAAKCGPCHTANNAGGHNLGAMFTAAVSGATHAVCAGKKKAECTILLIKSGAMPKGKGCSGNPTTDAAKAECLTQAEQDKVQAWVTAGVPE